MSFANTIEQYNWDDIQKSIYSKTKKDVELALAKEKIDLEDFKALISPAAQDYLEIMAAKSMKLTQERFGKVMQLYVPLYLSNACSNSCIYCGFSAKNKINRITLNQEQILKEAYAIKKMGFQHILLVTGEHKHQCGHEYLRNTIKLLKPLFAQISIEVQPMDVDQYKDLIEVGMHSVYVYQETYYQKNYKHYHPTGKKSDYKYRLETPDRLGQAGVHKIGIGCLLGLEEWRTDTFFTALHLSYLEAKYWKTKYSLSFPRLQACEGGFQPNTIINDRDLLQVMCAYRLLNTELEISLSTRETPLFRDNVYQLGVTAMSAGSKTEPGAYAVHTKALKQFEVSDQRSPKEIVEMLKKNKYEAIWKDWDASFMLNEI